MAAYFTLKPSSVGSVYSGRHGCACGCRGNHTTNPKTVKLICNKIEQAVADGLTPDVCFAKFGDQLGHIAVQTETRLYIAYINAE